MTPLQAVRRSYFEQEQQVQHAIAIIQKTHHVSIFQIDVPALREGIRRGQSPHDLAVQYYRWRES